MKLHFVIQLHGPLRYLDTKTNSAEHMRPKESVEK
ncbi:unnamed protein product [Brassica rapa subsp. narinosa]